MSNQERRFVINSITLSDPDRHDSVGPPSEEVSLAPADSEVQAARIAEAVAEWMPNIEPLVRSSVQAAEPTTVREAHRMLRETFPYVEYGLEKFGFLDLETLWHPENVRVFVDRDNAHRTKDSRKQTRWTLNQVGRAANKEHWPTQPEKLPKTKTALPYSAHEERALVQAALLRSEPGKPDVLAVAVFTLGAGLKADAIMSVGPSNIIELGAGRIGIHVKGSHPRLVPIRAEYTRMALKAVEFAGNGQFVRPQFKNAVYMVAKRATVHGFDLPG